MELTARVRFPARASDISLLHRVQTGSGTHPDFYPRRLNLPGCEVDHSLPSIVEVKNDGAIPQLLHMSSWCVV
jgi:hypothetical protein